MIRGINFARYPLCFAALFSMCGPPDPGPVTVEELASYFVNPTQAQDSSLAGRGADTAVLGAALRSIRSSSSVGQVRVRLTDTNGRPYLLGYETPNAVRTDTLYPLIIYLHGGTGTERNDKGDSAFYMLRDLRDTFDLFLASPSSNRYAPWWTRAGLLRIVQTLRYMTLHYPIDPDKVFLAGVSDGATGCYAAANTIPAPFAGFIAVSGFGGMLPTLGMQLVPGNMMRRPIYNVNAGLDRIYPMAAVREFVGSLQAQGVPVTAKYYENEQHGFDYRAQEMGTLAGLLRTWSRPQVSTISWTFVMGFPNIADNILDWTYSATDAWVEGLCTGDTLALRMRGLSSLTLALRHQGPLRCCFESDGDKVRTRKLSPLRHSWPLILKSMMHRCIPMVNQSVTYTIKP